MAWDRRRRATPPIKRSEEHTSELQSLTNLVCRLLLEKKPRAGKPATTGRAAAETARRAREAEPVGGPLGARRVRGEKKMLMKRREGSLFFFFKDRRPAEVRPLPPHHVLRT